jgi:hypothetical protein
MPQTWRERGEQMNQWNWQRTLLVPKFVLSLALLTSCSKDDQDDKKGSFVPDPSAVTTQSNESLARKIKIVDLSGQPIAKAKVLIGQRLNEPFAENFLEADSQGELIAPEAWNSNLAVTLAAQGYIRATFLNQAPRGQTFTLRPQESTSSLELNGVQTGFRVTNYDGIVDFGWVLPTFSRQELFNFRIDRFISLQLDELTILGQKIEIPSNIALPRQKESYVLPLTLEKPSYRMYFSSPGTKKVFSGRGQFPLRPLVDGLREGKDFFELANYFKINGGALRNIELSSTKTTANLPVNELSFSQSRSLRTPAFAQSQVLIGLALSADQGLLFPTDLKNVPANARVSLVTAPGSTPQLLALLKNKTETSGPGSDRFSAVLVPFEDGVRPQFLPLLRNPELISSNRFKSESISSIEGVSPVGSYLTLSLVEDKNLGSTTVPFLTKLWEVYDGEWSVDYDMPEWPQDNLPSGKKRWEVSRAGSLSADTGKTVDLGPMLFESVTHATHSSVDF